MRHCLASRIVVLLLGAAAPGCGSVNGNAPDAGSGPQRDAALPDAPADAARPDAPADARPDAPADARPDAPPDAPVNVCDAVWHDVQRGSDLDDQIFGMTVDADRNVYVAGFERGVTGRTNIEPDGDAQGAVIKFTPEGNVVWSAPLDVAGAADTVEDVAVEPSTGTVFAVGRTAGSFAGFSNAGQFDLFLTALDVRDGHRLTMFQWGDERPQHPLRLGLTANHEIAVAGFDDTYVDGNAVLAQEDGFIGLFDRGGAPPTFLKKFLNKVPNTRANRITGVAVDHDGSGAMYIAAYVSAPRAGQGLFVSKLAADGSNLWTKQISTITADAINAIGLSPANELFVTGATFQSLNGTNAGQQDAFLIKLDRATGAIVWSGQAGGPASDYPTALAFGPDGDIYIAGITLGALPGQTTSGGIDAFAVRFDPTGKQRSSWQRGTQSDELVTSIVVDRCGTALVGGHSPAAMVDGATSNGRYDMFIVRATL